MDFGQRIKNRRQELGLRVHQVATRIGESPSSYLEWENGRKITGEAVYPKLSEALKLSLSELMTGEVSQISSELEVIERSIKNIRSQL